MGEDRRHARFETSIPIRFNLNPTYHLVPGIRMMGVGGTIRKISIQDVIIESRLNLLNVCQIFPEQMEDDCPFELEVVLTNFKGGMIAYQGVGGLVSIEPTTRGIRHFQAGFRLKDDENRTAARPTLESIRRAATAVKQKYFVGLEPV